MVRVGERKQITIEIANVILLFMLYRKKLYPTPGKLHRIYNT